MQLYVPAKNRPEIKNWLKESALTAVSVLSLISTPSAHSMEEVIVIGTPIDISHIYQPTGPFWDAFWDAVQGLLAEAEEAPPDAATHQDWFEERQDLSCDSTVQDRAEWAAAAAGFKPAGTIYQVGYPGGGHQLWIISVRTWLAYEVAEYGSCIE